MKTSWTKNIKDKEHRELIQKEFKGSKYTRDRLKAMLKDKIEQEQRVRRNKNSYDDENWTLRQADSYGYMRALDEIISLISD